MHLDDLYAAGGVGKGLSGSRRQPGHSRIVAAVSSSTSVHPGRTADAEHTRTPELVAQSDQRGQSPDVVKWQVADEDGSDLSHLNARLGELLGRLPSPTSTK